MKKFILLCSAIFILIPSFVFANPIMTPGTKEEFQAWLDDMARSENIRKEFKDCQRSLEKLILNIEISSDNDRDILRMKSKPKSLTECKLMLDALELQNEKIVMSRKLNAAEDALNKRSSDLRLQTDAVAKLSSEIAQKIADAQKIQEELVAAKLETQAAIKSAEEAQNRFYIALGVAILALLAAIGLGIFGKKLK